MKKFWVRGVVLVMFVIGTTGLMRAARPWWVRATYEGEVIDSSNGSKMEMVEVHRGGQTTYTNFEGYFNFWEPGKAEDVFVLIHTAFEPQGGPVVCEKMESRSLEVDGYYCQVELVPTSRTILARVLNSFVGSPSEQIQGWELRLSSAWIYFHPRSRELWDSREGYVGTMVDRERILKYQRQQVKSFEIGAEFADLGVWEDPVTGETFENAVEYEVEYERTNLTRYTQKEHLVRVDKNWQ
ncbi:hypothetical protein L6258_02310, partial [Candidatus Parcubacteria bacterium]|nr:hypothetical protein [Candidatus Parcubacteria bacterium]